MTDFPMRSPSIRQWLTKPWVVPAAVGVVMTAVVLVLRPNLSLVNEMSPVVRVHLAAAIVAFGLGVVMLSSRKGASFHRKAGWIWAGVMAIVAGSSFFITEVTPGRWWFIHLLSGWTAISLPIALIAARRHSVKTHKRFMTGMFFGGLVIAGAFTFLPGRLMYQMFFG